MLVITCGVKDIVHIGDNVILKVNKIRVGKGRGKRKRPGVVSIGIDAPRQIAVHRQEVQDRIQRGITENLKKEREDGDMDRTRGEMA